MRITVKGTVKGMVRIMCKGAVKGMLRITVSGTVIVMVRITVKCNMKGMPRITRKGTIRGMVVKGMVINTVMSTVKGMVASTISHVGCMSRSRRVASVRHQPEQGRVGNCVPHRRGQVVARNGFRLPTPRPRHRPGRLPAWARLLHRRTRRRGNMASGEEDTWRGGRHLAGRAILGEEGETWREGRYLEGRAKLGREGDTWRGGLCLGERRYLEGRATHGAESDTWRGGRHLEGRVTPSGEGDTWTGGRHLEGRATPGTSYFFVCQLYVYKGIVKICVINKINIMEFRFVRNPCYLQHILSFTKRTSCHRYLQYKQL